MGYVHQQEHEHQPVEDENDLQVGVEYRVHDPSIKWKLMKPTLGELYESPDQLRFALTNYAVANGLQLWFKKSDKSRLIVACGRKGAKNHAFLDCMLLGSTMREVFRSNLCVTYICVQGITSLEVW